MFLAVAVGLPNDNPKVLGEISEGSFFPGLGRLCPDLDLCGVYPLPGDVFLLIIIPPSAFKLPVGVEADPSAKG